ncbi:MAG: ATP synthase F1 subunit delta [Planctomycetota bacterium]
MTASTVPAVYAAALYETAAEQGVVPRVVEECTALAQVLRDAPELIERVEHPSISRQQAQELVVGLFRDQVHELVLHFLQLLVLRDRFATAPAICDELVVHADLLAGVVPVQVITARRLGPAARERLNAALIEGIGQGVVIEDIVDESLIGGITLRIGDRIYDASLRRRIDAMHEHLATAPLGRVWDATEGENA